MGSLLAIKYWKGKFATVAGINPDYSYGRNNFAAFQALLKKFGVEHKVVADQWPKVGTLDLTSHVAALKAAKPDLDLLVAALRRPADLHEDRARRGPHGRRHQVRLSGGGLPAHAAQEGVHARGHDLRPQHALLRLDERRAPLQKQFVQEYDDKYKDYPHWEADRAYFAMQVYKAGVEAAYKAKNAWPGKEDIINAMEGVKVESLGGPGQMRKDHIAEQTFYQGLTTHKNNYDFPTLGTRGHDVLRPAAETARARTSGSGSRPRRSSCDSALTAFFDILHRRRLPRRRSFSRGRRAAARVRRAEDRQPRVRLVLRARAPTSASPR